MQGEGADDMEPLPPSLSPGDRRKEQDRRRRRECCVDPAEQADVLAVEKHVQIGRHAVACEQAALERGMNRHERGERLAHRARLDGDRAVPARLCAEHGRNADLRHCFKR